MSDEITPEEPKPPMMDVARPDIPAPKVDALGRSMANKRGRKPGPQAPKDTSKQVQTEVSKRLPPGTILSDENVGRAISGAFSAIGLFRGGHWRLFQPEEKKYGECFGPLARLYGPEELGKWITALLVVPVVAETLGPRLAVERMILNGDIKKEQGRLTLLQIAAMTEAEKHLNVEQQAKEGIEYLKAQASVGVQVAHEMKKAEIESEQLIVNGVETQ